MPNHNSSTSSMPPLSSQQITTPAQTEEEKRAAMQIRYVAAKKRREERDHVIHLCKVCYIWDAISNNNNFRHLRAPKRYQVQIKFAHIALRERSQKNQGTLLLYYFHIY